MAGELMKTAMAGKQGKCIGFVGLPGADNAKERINGYNAAVKGTGLELIDVRGDDIDQTRARANVDDVLVAHPEVNCMVGFYSYNPPRIYEAAEGCRQARPDHRRRLRRRPDHARRRRRGLVRRHRRAAAL